MSIAKDINKLLDNILDIKAEIRRIDLEITADQKLTNVQTGEKVNKQEVLEFVQSQINQIKNDLNKLTNNGKNVKGIFTNIYYVNDMIQDQEIVGKIKPKEKVSNKKSAKTKHPKPNNFGGRDEDKIKKYMKKMLKKKRKNKDLDDDLPF